MHNKSFGTTPRQLKLDNLKKKIETLLKFGACQQHSSYEKQEQGTQKRKSTSEKE